AMIVSFFFQAEDGIRDRTVTGVQTCALPISPSPHARPDRRVGRRLQRLAGVAALPVGARRGAARRQGAPHGPGGGRTNILRPCEIGRASCRERVGGGGGGGWVKTRMARDRVC